MDDAAVSVRFEVDATEAQKALGRVERAMLLRAIEPVVVAWCPNLNAYAQASFIDELLRALGAHEDALL